MKQPKSVQLENNHSSENNQNNRLLKSDRISNRDKIYPPWLICAHKDYWEIRTDQNPASESTSLFFNKEIAPGKLLNTPLFSSLREDLETSYLYMIELGYVNKAYRLPSIHNNIVNFLYHVNELRVSKGQNLALALDQILLEEFLSFIKCYAPSIESVTSIVEQISSKGFKGTDKEWREVEQGENISKKEFSYIRHRIEHSKNKDIYNSLNSEGREYCDANKTRCITELHLPNLKTIGTVSGEIDLLFKASIKQTKKFGFSTIDALESTEASLFREYQSPRSTPVMPLETAFHLISKAAEFCHKYGSHLLTALCNFDEKMLKLQSQYKLPKIKFGNYHKDVFDKTNIPTELDELNINCFGFKDEGLDQRRNFFREGMSLCSAIQLYFAAVFILLTTYLATRKMSVDTLKRNCFEISILDDLHEVIFKQLKTKEASVSQIIRRPINSTIYDFGLQLVELSTYLEGRHNVFTSEEDGFLFTNFARRDMLWRFQLHSEGYSSPSGLSNDTIQELLDQFSDWCECPLYEENRWYPTSHQLRKIFAVLYFNLTDESGIEELSWMLGHDALEVTFGYAELHPDEGWLEEAKVFLAKHAKDIVAQNHSSDEIKELIQKSETTCININLQLESVVYEAINQHIKETGKEVHFKKIENGNIYFYFTGKEEHDQI